MRKARQWLGERLEGLSRKRLAKLERDADAKMKRFGSAQAAWELDEQKAQVSERRVLHGKKPAGAHEVLESKLDKLRAEAEGSLVVAKSLPAELAAGKYHRARERHSTGWIGRAISWVKGGKPTEKAGKKKA